MTLRHLRLAALAACLLSPAIGGWASQGASVQAEAGFRIVTVADSIVTRLPAHPLYWRVERFATLAEAQAAAGPLALAAEASGRAWLFTLGAAGGATPGGQIMAEIGPVPIVAASRYLLRINHAGGPPGARTPVHSHPGSEAFYVLAGQLTQRTAHGVARLDAGEAMNGHQPGQAMQLTSSGAVPLDQLVMFVVDADRPFAPAARLD